MKTPLAQLAQPKKQPKTLAERENEVVKAMDTVAAYSQLTMTVASLISQTIREVQAKRKLS